MNKLKLLSSLLNEVFYGSHLGDLAGLKIAISNPTENTVLQNKVKNLLPLNSQQITLPYLEKFDEGTLGKEYFNFLKKNKLSIINFSSKYNDVFVKFPLGIRYTRVHDIFHILLGFDTTIAGELGVYSYVATKNYNTSLNKAYQTIKILSHIAGAFNIRAITLADQMGRKLALESGEPILIDWEKKFDQNLNSIRRELNIQI